MENYKAAYPPIPALQDEERNIFNSAQVMPGPGPALASHPIGGTSATFVTNGNPNPVVGPHSTELTCPNCRCRIKTNVRHRTTTRTHIACLLLSWTLCCCCLPYCMDSCRNANHFCPMCQTYIGTYES